MISKATLKTGLKNFIGTIVFWLLFVCMFVMLTSVLANTDRPAENGYEKRITYAYRGEPRNTIDMAVIGNSDAYRGFSPLDFYNETGVTAVVSGEPKRSVQDVKGVVKDILKYQKPKYLVLETDCVFGGWNKPPKQKKKQSVVKSALKNNALITAVLSKLNGKDKLDWKSWDSALVTGLNYEVPLMRHHDNWRKVRLTTLFNGNREYYRYANKGMAFSSTTKKFCQPANYMNYKPGVKGKMTRSDMKAIQEVIDICRRNGITPVFMTVPSANSWNHIKSIAVQKVADQNGIKYYDFNRALPTGFNWDLHSKDGGNHLNYEGAKILTRCLAQILQRDLKLKPTNLTALQKYQWEADNKYFHEKIAKDLGSKK